MAFQASQLQLPAVCVGERPASSRARPRPATNSRHAPQQRLAARTSVARGHALTADHSVSRSVPRVVKVSAAVANAQTTPTPLVFTTPNLGMPVTLTRLPNSRMRLRAEVPLSFCETAYKEILEECKKAVGSFDGYRKGGKVPANLIIRGVGKDTFLNKIGEFILTGTMVEASSAVSASAMQDSERVVTPPLDIISNFSGKDCEPKGPSIYEFEVDVFPEVSFKGDYKQLSVSVEAAGDSVSEAKDVEDFIRAKQKELSPLRVVSTRGMATGDTVVLNVDACRVNADGTDGEALEFASVRRLRMDTSEEQDVVPGFVESLSGQKTGEQRTFEIVLPQNLGREELRGVKARFSTLLLELFERTLVPLTDEVAPKIMSDCTTMQQVRDQLLKVQKVVTEGNTKSRVREALILALGGITAAELPASLVQENGREMYSSDLLEKQAKGQIDPAIVKQLLTPPMVQRHIEKNKAVIEKNVLSSLALDALAKELNIVPTEADLSAAVAQTREEFKAMGQEFDEERLRSEIAEAKRNEMTVDWLEKNNKVTITPYKSG